MTALNASLQVEALCALAARQIDHFFPDGETVDPADLLASARTALTRLEHCFSRVNNRYFFDGQRVVFDHLHGDQYAMWLYFLGNQLYRDKAPENWCKKLFLLNKALHGCDIYFAVELPSIFLLVHPLGTVLGRGQYDDYFLVYQRCGIGSNRDVYPKLGKHVSLRPGSAVLGASTIGDNVTVAAESLVLDRDIEANTTYFGNPRDFTTRQRTTTESIWRI